MEDLVSIMSINTTIKMDEGIKIIKEVRMTNTVSTNQSSLINTVQEPQDPSMIKDSKLISKRKRILTAIFSKTMSPKQIMTKFSITRTKLNYIYRVIRDERMFEAFIKGKTVGRNRIVSDDHIKAIK